MGIANIVNTAGGGGGSSEIITHLVNSVDGAGLRLANQGYISCADVSANRFGTNDFSVEFVLSQETSAINADIFISNLNGSNQAVDAAVIRWDVIQNDNIQLVFTNSGAAETAYNFGYDPAPDLNEPTHYLVSADRSGNAVLYRNGAEIASVSIAASGSANVGNSGQPTVIGSPVNNFGVTGNVYRFRTYSKALSSDEAKNVFDRADVPTALVSNLLLDLDCAYANPTQSTVIQDRGPNNQDGTLNGTITQTNVIKQLNSTSARIGTTAATTAATPADGEIIAGSVTAKTGTTGGITIDASGQTDTTARFELKADRPSADQDACDIRFYNNNAQPIAVIAAVKSSSANDTDGKLDFYTSNAKRLTIDSTGQALFSGSKVTVNTDGTVDWGNAADAGRLTWDTNDAKVRGVAGKNLKLGANNTDYVTIDTTGLASFSNGITVSGGILALTDPSGGALPVLTISSGAITITSSVHQVEVESGTTDDLITINGGTVGAIVMLRSQTNGKTVVVKDQATGGNFLLNGDFSMASNHDTITLLKTGTYWQEISRSDNA